MSRNWLQSIPTAEAYWIGRVLYDTQHQPAEMTRFRADPDAYLEAFPLSPQTKAALARNDIALLYLAGANPYLLRAHCLELRIPEAEYLDALRSVQEVELG